MHNATMNDALAHVADLIELDETGTLVELAAHGLHGWRVERIDRGRVTAMWGPLRMLRLPGDGPCWRARCHRSITACHALPGTALAELADFDLKRDERAALDLMLVGWALT